MKIYLFLSLFISSFRSQKVSGSEDVCYTVTTSDYPILGHCYDAVSQSPSADSLPPPWPSVIAGGGQLVGQSHVVCLRSGSLPHFQSHQQEMCQREGRADHHARERCEPAILLAWAWRRLPVPCPCLVSHDRSLL